MTIPGASQPNGDVTGDPGRPVIVVIDDDASALRALRRFLHASGFDTVAFESAEAYLAAGPGLPAACLVVDHHLGGISGLELARGLRAAQSPLPVILTTGDSEDGTRAEAARLGAAWLCKPFDGDAILGLLVPLRPPLQ
jgi:FixJ family two-component response regulator